MRFQAFCSVLLLLTFCIGCSAKSDVNSSSSHSSEESKLVCGDSRFDLYVPYLHGKRIALVVNHASVVNGTHLCDTLISQGVDVVKILAPEHGFRGKADAGEAIADNLDSRTGLPVISLYGKNKRPSETQLSDVDVVIYDLQDVGVRFYTYISTLHYVMDACAEYGKTLIVLDRPNPNGNYIDGPVLQPDCKSFVGMDPIPVVYGLTPGELAGMINGEDWLENGRHCDLKVVKMLNYDYSKVYDVEIAPSPNLRSTHAIRLYPSLCFFEATNVSVGRGTDTPFELFGAPQSDLGDYTFTPVSCEGAKDPLHKDVKCYGRDLRGVNDSCRLDLSYFIEMHRMMKDGFWKNPKFFDLLTGNKSLRAMIDDGMSEAAIRSTWSDELTRYASMREHYLLYKPEEESRPSIVWEDAMHTPWVDSLYNAMTDEERIAQLVWVTLDGYPQESSIKRVCDIVENNHIGGVLIMQMSVHQVKSIVKRIASHAKYPLIFAIDAENGINMKFDDAVAYPKNMSLGAIRDITKLQRLGEKIGDQLRACGIEINFAPVVDVNTNPLNPIIGTRSFGEETHHVRDCGMAITRGIQSKGVIAVLKHFPGHGDTDKDSHLLLPAVTHERARLDSIDLLPFREIVNDGVMGVMSAHLIVPALDSSKASSSMSYPMLTELLRNEMNFKGLVISDAMNMIGAIEGAAGRTPETLALMAGNDVAEFSTNVPRAVSSCMEKLESGEFDRSLLESKVRRLLAAKQWCNLDKGRWQMGCPAIEVNSIEAELLAKELFASSVTVLDTTNIQMPVGKTIALGEWTGLNAVSVDNKHVWMFVDETSLSQCQSVLAAEKAKGSKVVVVYAGNPYRLKKVNFAAYGCGLVVAYENQKYAKDALLEFVLIGGHADGVMPVSVGQYKVGTSYDVTRTGSSVK